MSHLIPVLSLLATIIVFAVNKKLYNKLGKSLLTPLLITPLVLIGILLLTGLPYETYNEGGQWLTKLLGPATVAFAVPIYKNLPLLKKNAAQILVSMLSGSAVAIVSSFIFAGLLGLSHVVMNSLVPRSITTPIAMDISTMIGGTPTLTAVFVIVTGVLGSILGPQMIRILSIKTPSSRGLLLGMGAHGAGTSKAFEFGEVEGTFSSLAMIVAGLISIVLSATLFPFFETAITALL